MNMPIPVANTPAEEVESSSEVRRSQQSPGGFATIKKGIRLPAPGENPSVVITPLPTAWILYDFTVNGHELKSEHKKGIKQIVSHILDTYAYHSPDRIIPIQVNGYASKSGTRLTNYNLAVARAGSARLELLLKGLPANWIADPKGSDQMDVHLVPQQDDRWKRGASRSVLIILPQAFLLPPTQPFAPPLRRRVWEDLNASRYSPAEEKLFYPFAIWALINWDYLIAHRYTWRSGVSLVENKDGLFFRPPGDLTPWSYLRTVKQARTYLSRLHEEFRAAWLRYQRQYTAAGGAGMVIDVQGAYQQSLRWLSLNHYASTSKVPWKRLEVNMGYAEGYVKGIHIWAKTQYPNPKDADARFFKPLNAYLLQQGVPCQVTSSSPAVQWRG